MKLIIVCPCNTCGQWLRQVLALAWRLRYVPENWLTTQALAQHSANSWVLFHTQPLISPTTEVISQLPADVRVVIALRHPLDSLPKLKEALPTTDANTHFESVLTELYAMQGWLNVCQARSVPMYALQCEKLWRDPVATIETLLLWLAPANSMAEQARELICATDLAIAPIAANTATAFLRRARPGQWRSLPIAQMNMARLRHEGYDALQQLGYTLDIKDLIWTTPPSFPRLPTHGVKLHTHFKNGVVFAPILKQYYLTLPHAFSAQFGAWHRLTRVGDSSFFAWLMTPPHAGDADMLPAIDGAEDALNDRTLNRIAHWVRWQCHPPYTSDSAETFVQQWHTHSMPILKLDPCFT